MDVNSTMSTTDARKQLFQLTKAVQTPGRVFTLTENGKPKAVLMNAQEYESWIETLEVLSENPGIIKDMEKVKRDIESGEIKNYPTLEEVLADEGFVVADKSKKGYEVSSKVSTQGKKKPKKNS